VTFDDIRSAILCVWGGDVVDSIDQRSI